MLVQEIYHNGELLGVEITCNGDALHVAYSRPWEGLRLGTFPRMFDDGEPVTYERKTVYSHDVPQLENYQGRIYKRKSSIEWPGPYPPIRPWTADSLFQALTGRDAFTD